MMARAKFNLEVSHSQIAAFDSKLAQPFNMWTKKHVDQGFAWRPGSASFRTIAGGPHSIMLSAGSGEKDAELSPDAIRIIQVPFNVPSSGLIEISSISDSSLVELPPGQYQLIYECSAPEQGIVSRINLKFRMQDSPTFDVLRADDELSLTGELCTRASPA
jgi:hypothetical protein